MRKNGAYSIRHIEVRRKNEVRRQGRICVLNLYVDVCLFDILTAPGARQFSAVHHRLNRSVSDVPRCGDCDGPQRRPELRFERGQGAGSWTTWLRNGHGGEERFRMPGGTIMGFTQKQSGFLGSKDTRSDLP